MMDCSEKDERFSNKTCGIPDNNMKVCQDSWTNIMIEFPDIAHKNKPQQNWNVLRSLLQIPERRKIYTEKILMHNDWDNSSISNALEQTDISSEYFARIWAASRLQIKQDKQNKNNQTIFFPQNHTKKWIYDIKDENINELNVKESLLDRIIWWSAPDGEQLQNLWEKSDNETRKELLKKFGILPETIQNPILTLFHKDVIKTWRKPTCLDGITFENFMLNDEKSLLFGQTKSLNDNENHGFSEIVHTVKSEWSLKWSEREICQSNLN